MTRILRLEMKGFKSFANKTEVPFGPAFNCVLGPNGSGKSNILDAICFVLGKGSAKGLRAEKSANLIYNGGKTKSPAKEGEVAIVFSNEKRIFGDFPELIIKRIVFQNGQSKYKLNGKTATRQEILDILSKDKIDPDGYNIILQGDINNLIEMSPQQRRQIIEQIAGISVYEEKKEKALRELQRTEEKIQQAEIVLAERKTYLRELKKDANHAQKFKELDEKIKRNKTTLLTRRRTKKIAELTCLEKKAGSSLDELKKLQEKEMKLREEIEERKKQIDEINKEVERRGEKEQVKIHKEVEELKVERAVKRQRLETLESELFKVQQRKEELQTSSKELVEKIRVLEQEKIDAVSSIKGREEQIAKLDARLAEFRKKHNMEDASKIDEEIIGIDKEADEIQGKISKLREEQQNLLREKDKVEIKLEQIDDKIAKVLNIEHEHKKELDELKQKKENFKTATKELNAATTEDSSLAAQLQNARSSLATKKLELSKLQGQQLALTERIAGGAAIAKILELRQAGTIQGIHGTVTSLGQASEEFALALEIAAGNRINAIVVDTDETAAKCIRYLRENRLGVATFLPLNKLKAQDEKPAIKKSEDVLGLAVELVSYEAKYDVVFRYVFGSTIVMRDIDAARRFGIGKARMVTLQGDLLDVSGSMQGGFRHQEKKGVFQQREAAERIARLEAEVADLEAVLSRIEVRRKENEELITRLRELKANLEGDIIKGEKALHLDSEDIGASKEEKKRLETEHREFERRFDDVIANVTELTSKLSMLKSRKQQLRDQITALRSPAVLAEMNSFEEKKRELQAEIAEFHSKLRSSEAEAKNILGPEAERIQSILKQQEKELKQFSDEKRGAEEKLKELEAELKVKEAEENKFMSQFKDLFTKRNKLDREINGLENDVRSTLEKARDIDNKKVAFSLEMARLKAELAGVEEELKQYEGIEPYTDDEKSEEDILLEVRDFERMAQAMGAVNMKALQIYEQVETEYNELVKKKKKLGDEREDVLVMINEIDAKKKELFKVTFDVVNHNFQYFFSQLTTKGDASLELEIPDDPFAGGMTIKARLTGKKPLDIRSLSGGEKTLTALAFLFAVQEHEPASFYIMDEVDAALDKQNSNLLAKLIRKYCDRAQYIIISHNDGVISEADNLYGISMNEHGVSKVTTLKI